MTILEKTIDRCHDIIDTIGGNPTFILSSHDKHPVQNNFLAQLASGITSRGISCQFRNQNQNINGRDVLIIIDDKRDLETRNQWSKVTDANKLRWIITLGSEIELEDLENEYVLDQEYLEVDTDGETPIRVLKRVKVRI